MMARLAEAALRAYSRIAPTERGGYRLARLVRGFRHRQQWVDHFVTPDNLKMQLDLGTYPDCCMAYGLYELDTARLIKRLLKRGDHFIDAGANIGYFTMIAARCVGPSGRVDAFEPHPANRQRLIDHLQENHLFDAVFVHDVALSDRAGVATMHMPRGGTSNHGMASLYTPAGESESVAVQTVRMDEILQGLHPKLIKMDVEGAEPLVVAGMEGLLKVENPPMIIAEYNTELAAQAKVLPREFIDRLLAIQPRYKLDIIGRKLRPIDNVDAALARRVMANLLFSAG